MISGLPSSVLAESMPFPRRPHQQTSGQYDRNYTLTYKRRQRGPDLDGDLEDEFRHRKCGPDCDGDAVRSDRALPTLVGFSLS
jgi:hypothetical protein